MFCYYCRGQQVNLLCSVEELIPSIGASVPTPVVLAAALCQSESTIRNIGKLCSDLSNTTVLPFSSLVQATPLNSQSDLISTVSTNLISISDDGKIWNWLMTSERTKVSRKNALYPDETSYTMDDLSHRKNMGQTISSNPDNDSNFPKESDQHRLNSHTNDSKSSFKVESQFALPFLSNICITKLFFYSCFKKFLIGENIYSK